MFRWKNKGFTLIELRVVISIAAILMALGSVSYTTAQRKARDAKRRGDMKTISNAFEQYYSVNSGYGTLGEMTDPAAGFLPAGLPTDPKPSQSYTVSANSGSQRYCVCAILETDTGNADAPSGATCDFSTANGYYCIGQQQ